MLPSFIYIAVAHIKFATVALVVMRFSCIIAAFRYEMVCVYTGGEESVGATVRARADPTSRLRMLAAVWEKVSMSQRLGHAQETTVRVNSFHVMCRTGV